MQSKWLVRSATSIALVAIMAVETVCPVPAHAGVPGLFATEYTQSSTMSSWPVSSKSRS